MEAQGFKRRLAAILAADVVGYSRLMNQREEATLASLNECLALFRELIPAHGGRIFGGAGDSVIAEFPSTVEAVRCAVRIQQALDERNTAVTPDAHMQFRIGINVGDVMVEGDNLMGEGVNVAARLEGLATPGGINVSADVYRQVHNKIDLGFKDLGMQQLKNIPEPVQVYQVVMDPSAVVAPPASRRTLKTVLSKWQPGLMVVIVIIGIGLAFWSGSQRAPIISPEMMPSSAGDAPLNPDNPSIAVLPFANISADASQDYFVDGITEDLITELSRLSNLTVIARHTSFTYKGESVKPLEVGKALGVRYLIEGSVRKAGERLRITAQLVDTGSGKNIWAERYDRKLEDIFAVQDEVTRKIVTALAVKLTVAEKKQFGRFPTTSFAAYELFLQGQKYYQQRTPEANALARDAYMRAIDIDPAYARAYGALAVVLSYDLRRGWTESPVHTRERVLELAQKAVALDHTSPQAYWALGFVHLFRKEYNEAEAAVNQAVTLAPNYADGYGLLAFINNFQGRAEEAVRYIRKAMALNPHYTFDYPWNLGWAYYTLGRYPEAIDALKKALERNENILLPRLYLAACYVRLGQLDEANWEVEQVKTAQAKTTLSHLASTMPIKNRDQMNAFLADLRKAGLPE